MRWLRAKFTSTELPTCRVWCWEWTTFTWHVFGSQSQSWSNEFCTWVSDRDMSYTCFKGLVKRNITRNISFWLVKLSGPTLHRLFNPYCITLFDLHLQTRTIDIEPLRKSSNSLATSITKRCAAHHCIVLRLWILSGVEVSFILIFVCSQVNSHSSPFLCDPPEFPTACALWYSEY